MKTIKPRRTRKKLGMSELEAMGRGLLALAVGVERMKCALGAKNYPDLVVDWAVFKRQVREFNRAVGRWRNRGF